MKSESKQIATILIGNRQEEDYGVVIIRTLSDGTVGLTVSLKHDGDTEIYLKKEDCFKIIKALKEATA
jgi:hypothetical protein